MGQDSKNLVQTGPLLNKKNDIQRQKSILPRMKDDFTARKTILKEKRRTPPPNSRSGRFQMANLKKTLRYYFNFLLNLKIQAVLAMRSDGIMEVWSVI